MDKLPFYGTPQWDAMSATERYEYSRHECAALCGAGIWFENKLMQIVLRHLAELPVTDPSHRYLLVEVADECRHSTMFGEYIRRAGTPAYAPDGTDGAIGKRTTSTILTAALNEAGIHTVMVGTGQTGLMQGAAYGGGVWNVWSAPPAIE